MRSRGYGGLAMVALAVVAIAGCGGGGTGSSGDQGEALTRAEFVKAASSLCRRSRQATEGRLNKAKALLGPGAAASRQAREKAIRYMVVAPSEELGEDLQRLGPIKGGDEALEAYVAALAKDAKKARARPLTVTAGTAFLASDAIANEQNLPICVH